MGTGKYVCVVQTKYKEYDMYDQCNILMYCTSTLNTNNRSRDVTKPEKNLHVKFDYILHKHISSYLQHSVRNL